jgi:hypothetical protein
MGPTNQRMKLRGGRASKRGSDSPLATRGKKAKTRKGKENEEPSRGNKEQTNKKIKDVNATKKTLGPPVLQGKRVSLPESFSSSSSLIINSCWFMMEAFVTRIKLFPACQVSSEQ